jgi:hypothetical protein
VFILINNDSDDDDHHHHHHLVAVMKMAHFLARSVLTRPEVSSVDIPWFLLSCGVKFSLSWVTQGARGSDT